MPTNTAKLHHKVVAEREDAQEGTENSALISDDLNTGDITGVIIAYSQESHIGIYPLLTGGGFSVRMPQYA